MVVRPGRYGIEDPGGIPRRDQDQKEVSRMRDALLALCAYVVTIVLVTRR